MISNITLLEFEEKLKNKETFAVDFYADWCQACVEMLPIVEEVAQVTSVPFYKVNIDDQPELKERNHIKAIPMIMMYAEGRTREFVYGKVEREKIEQKLNRIK